VCNKISAILNVVCAFSKVFGEEVDEDTTKTADCAIKGKEDYGKHAD